MAPKETLAKYADHESVNVSCQRRPIGRVDVATAVSASSKLPEGWFEKCLCRKRDCLSFNTLSKKTHIRVCSRTLHGVLRCSVWTQLLTNQVLEIVLCMYDLLYAHDMYQPFLLCCARVGPAPLVVSKSAPCRTDCVFAFYSPQPHTRPPVYRETKAKERPCGVVSMKFVTHKFI